MVFVQLEVRIRDLPKTGGEVRKHTRRGVSYYSRVIGIQPVLDGEGVGGQVNGIESGSLRDKTGATLGKLSIIQVANLVPDNVAAFLARGSMGGLGGSKDAQCGQLRKRLDGRSV